MLLDLFQVTLVFSVGWLVVNAISFLWHRNWKWSLISSALAFIVVFVFVYAVMPNKSLSALLHINLVLALFAALLNISVYGGNVLWQKIQTIGEPKSKRGQALPRHAAKFSTLITALILALIGLVIISNVTRLTSINDVYQSIPAQTKKEAKLLTSTKDMPIALAPETAKRKMQQKFSVIPNSNMYHLDGITAQIVDGKYVYVATVEFNGFFRWLKNRDVPGYFMISATDVNAQPEFIKQPLTYSPTAYFNYDAARRIYAAAPTYANTGRINLEIADDGTPYYVQTLYREYGVSGRMRFDRFKTAVLNAQTGEVKLYDAKNAPEFVDASITSAAANDMNEFYGRYGRGWWNQTSFGAKRDVKVPTENGIYASGQITPLMDENGDLLYFTDFTSGNTDQDSALGYSLINARTGELTYYRDNGSGLMDSDGAIAIADKIYPEKKWEARMPILYNIDGVPTWVISLMDSKGIFKKYVYVNAIDNDIVVDGNRAQEALDDYRVRLSENNANLNADEAEMKQVTGKINRVVVTNNGDETVVNFLLDGDKLVYKIQADQAPQAIFLQKGDDVSFEANVLPNATTVTLDDITIKALP